MGLKDIAWLAVGAVFLCFVLRGKEESSASFQALDKAIEGLESNA